MQYWLRCGVFATFISHFSVPLTRCAFMPLLELSMINIGHFLTPKEIYCCTSLCFPKSCRVPRWNAVPENFYLMFPTSITVYHFWPQWAAQAQLHLIWPVPVICQPCSTSLSKFFLDVLQEACSSIFTWLNCCSWRPYWRAGRCFGLGFWCTRHDCGRTVFPCNDRYSSRCSSFCLIVVVGFVIVPSVVVALFILVVAVQIFYFL